MYYYRDFVMRLFLGYYQSGDENIQKDSLDLQIHSLLGFMDVLGYSPNKCKEGEKGFVCRDLKKYGNFGYNISLHDAIRLHNSPEYSEEYGIILLGAERYRLVERVGLQYNKKKKLMTTNRRYVKFVKE